MRAPKCAKKKDIKTILGGWVKLNPLSFLRALEQGEIGDKNEGMTNREFSYDSSKLERQAKLRLMNKSDKNPIEIMELNYIKIQERADALIYSCTLKRDDKHGKLEPYTMPTSA